MGSFADSIKANIKEVKQEVNDKIVSTFIDLAYSIVDLTPSPSWNGIRGLSGNTPQYTDGLLANQWYPEENKISSQETGAKSDTASDSYSRIKAMQTAKTFLGKDGYLSFTNNVPYAYRVEVLGYPEGQAVVTEGYGHWNYWNGSHAEPYAMIEQSVIKIKAKL